MRQAIRLRPATAYARTGSAEKGLIAGAPCLPQLGFGQVASADHGIQGKQIQCLSGAARPPTSATSRRFNGAGTPMTFRSR